MTDFATVNSKLYIVVNYDPITGTPLTLKQQFYLPPSGGLIGAVKQGTNITIGGDGTINAFIGPGAAVTSLAVGSVGTLRTGSIRFLTGSNLSIVDNNDGTFTWNITGQGATKLSQLTDVKITEPTLVNTLNTITNVSPTVLTVSGAAPSNLALGDWIRGDSTDNGYVTQITNITGNNITLAATGGFGFSTNIFKVSSVSQAGFGLVWDTASNAFITQRVVQSIQTNGDVGVYGNVNLVAGTNTTLVRTNNNIQINSTGGGTGSTVSVDGVVVAAPNFQDNPAALGTDLTVTGSNVTAAVRDADVNTIANRQDSANIGAPGNLRTQVSGGSAATTLIINNFASPATMEVTVSGSLSAATLAAALNSAGSTTISNAQVGGTLLTVANYTAPGLANNQVQCNFPSGVTPAMVSAVFGGLRSDAVWAGTVTSSSFQFTTSNGSPRRAIPALFAAGANVTLTRDATTDITTIASTGGSGGTPGGSNTQIQFNNNGAFGASAGLTWNGTSGLQLGTVAAPAPLVVGNAAVPTAVTPGTLGQVLTSSVTGVYWGAGGSGTTPPGGANTQIQFNNNGVFGASTGLTWLGSSGLQLGTIAAPAPLMVGNAAVATAITAGTAGQVLTSGGPTALTYWANASGGATTLQGLTDVAITEPVFAQVGTATVVSISAGTTSITVTSAAGILVGDWLRGGTVMPGQVPALQVISIAGTLIEFNLDPTAFFAVGNFIYRLPATLEGARLSFSNAQNKWISSESLNFLPMDTISWVSLAGDPYVSVTATPVVVAPVTTNVLNLASPWTFGIATLGTFPSPSEVCGVDALGRQVTGQYVSAAQAGTPTAILEAIKFDRVSGGSFVINNTYPLTWRQGTFALPDYVRFNTTTNLISQGLTAVDNEIAAKIGSVPTTYTNSNVTTVSTGFGNSGTTANILTTSFAAGKAFLQTLGAIPVVGGLGDWTLPVWPILISNIQNPTSLQQATVTRITENTSNSLLQIAFSGNPTYFANAGASSQALWFQSNKFTYQAAPETEIIRLAQANNVNSLNTYQGAVTLAGSASVAIAANPNTRTLTFSATGSGGVSASNSTTYNSTQSATNGIYINQTATGAIANALCIGMPLRMATAFDANSSGGSIGSVLYVSSGNVLANQRGISFPTSANPLPEFRIAVTFPSFVIDVEFTANGAGNDARNGDIAPQSAWFSRANLQSGDDPRINTNLFPLFNNGQGGNNEGFQLSPYVPPVIISRTLNSGTAAVASFRYVISGSEYRATGVSANYVGTATEYHPYLELDETNTGEFISNAALITTQPVPSQPAMGGIEIFLAIQGTGGNTPSLSQVTGVGNTTALPIIYQDSQVTPRTISLGAPTTIATSYTLKLPTAQGAASTALLNDGSGNLSWGTPPAGTLAWDIYSVATRYNSTITPVTGISATFTIPAATVTGTVHYYNRFNNLGVPTAVYRFVPITDSSVLLLSYDSFWSGFNGSALSGLLIQRGNF